MTRRAPLEQEPLAFGGGNPRGVTVGHVCTTEPACLCSSSGDECCCIWHPGEKSCRDCGASIVAIDFDSGEPLDAPEPRKAPGPMIFDHTIPCPHCGGSVPLQFVQAGGGGGGGGPLEPAPASSSTSRLASWWRRLWPAPPAPSGLIRRGADVPRAFVTDIELAYLNGGRAAWQRLLSLALFELNHEGVLSPDRQRVALLVAEREAVVSQLRMLCRDFGDNDWQPGDHLADVVDKHLGRHLHAADLARGKS